MALTLDDLKPGSYSVVTPPKDDGASQPLTLDDISGYKVVSPGAAQPHGDFDMSQFAPPVTRPITHPTGANMGMPEVQEAAKQAQAPTRADSFYAGLRGAASFGFGDEVEAAAQWLKNKATGPANAPGYAELRDAFRARDQGDEAAHPWAAMGGRLAGTALSAPAIPALGGETMGAQMFRQGAMASGLNAAGDSKADLTRGQVPQFLADTATGAGVGGILGGTMGKLVGDAPKRVLDRAVEATVRGEAGGTARGKLATKAISAMGDEGQGLAAALADEPSAMRTLSVSGKNAPGKAAAKMTDVIGKTLDKAHAFYPKIDEAGGVDLTLVAQRLDRAKQAAIDNGMSAEASVAERAKNMLVKLYSEPSAVPGVKQMKVVPAQTARNLANQLGENLFDGQVDPTFAKRAKMAVYGQVVDAIADAGERAGLDVAELRRLNGKASTLISVRDALADRAARAQAGHTTLGNALVHSGATAGALGALASGHGKAAIGLLAADFARKAAMPTARAADYALSRLVTAASSGSTTAQLGKMAVELGVARPLAKLIAEQGLGAIRSQEESQP